MQSGVIPLSSVFRIPLRIDSGGDLNVAINPHDDLGRGKRPCPRMSWACAIRRLVEFDDASVWIEIDVEVFFSDETETGGHRNVYIKWIKTKYQVTLDPETCQEALGHSNNEFEIKTEQLVTRLDFVEILREHFRSICNESSGQKNSQNTDVG